MTKADLVAAVVEETGISRLEAQECFEAIIDGIVDALKRGDKVELRGFGSFRIRQRGPREGRNPKTGEPVKVPAKLIPHFKPGKDIREALLKL